MEDLHKLITEKCLLKYKQISKKDLKDASSDNEWSPLAAVALVENSLKNSSTGIIPNIKHDQLDNQLHAAGKKQLFIEGMIDMRGSYTTRY